MGTSIFGGTTQFVVGLRDAVGSAGTVARVGGDEFGVLLLAPVDGAALDALATAILSAMDPWHLFKENAVNDRGAGRLQFGDLRIEGLPVRRHPGLADDGNESLRFALEIRTR